MFAIIMLLCFPLPVILLGIGGLIDGSMGPKESLLVLLLGLLMLLGTSIYAYFKLLKPWRCPSCKKFFAIKGNGIDELEADEFFVNETSHSVKTSKVETGLGTFKVETPESHTEQVKYTQRNYQKKYICKYCGEEFYKTFSGARMRG
ncbi:hypothetical protein [Pseudobutyrivibrio sp.]|uniref:hypothetical protein n=1 Tax=Pseudobutyrivibrio sp. TaxID=2014367 RepID=UPI0025E10EDF|nr:hypothetical protein [Pseudobutyrivibrio sp.]